MLGEAICSFLISNGAKLAIHHDGAKGNIGITISIRERRVFRLLKRRQI